MRARVAATARQQQVGARRNTQTVPRLGSEQEMQADAIAQLQARIARQKEIVQATQHTEQEELDEMWKWVKISVLVAAPVLVLTSIKDIILNEHDHRKPGPEPDYMRIRNKPFPWECEDCELFNRDCWKQCRAEKAAEAGN